MIALTSLTSIKIVSIVSFFVSLIIGYYLLLDDFKVWKENRNFSELKSEDFAELYGQLKMNRVWLLIEIFAIMFLVTIFILSPLIDLKQFVHPILLQIIANLILVLLIIYRVKVRMKKSIQLFQNIRRTPGL